MPELRAWRGEGRRYFFLFFPKLQCAGYYLFQEAFHVLRNAERKPRTYSSRSERMIDRAIAARSLHFGLFFCAGVQGKGICLLNRCPALLHETQIGQTTPGAKWIAHLLLKPHLLLF